MSDTGLPPPIFEGSEKRLELDFSFIQTASETGLRQLTRRQIDCILDKVMLAPELTHQLYYSAYVRSSKLPRCICIRSMHSLTAALCAGLLLCSLQQLKRTP